MEIFLSRKIFSFLCILSIIFIAHAQDIHDVSAPLGKEFKVPNLLVKQQSRIVFYRLASDKSPGAVSVYIGGAYQTSLQRGAYSQICLPPTKVEVSARMTENGQTVRESYDVINSLTLEAGKETFVQVFEEANGHALMMVERPEKALPELIKTREQLHTLSRVPKAMACQDADKPAPKPIKPKTITLGADALFPIGKSDVSTISPRGHKMLDELIANIKKEYGTDGNVRLHIIGHADKYGNEAHNLALSKDRAAAIKTYLAEGGIPRRAMSTDGRGDKEPVVLTCGKAPTKENIACNKPNRRVVIEVTVTKLVEATN
jgi:OOP family OmpA-OmpF porin